VRTELAVVKLTDISTGERRRQDYGDMVELIHSIKSKGLIHPIYLSLNPGSNPPYLLVAGGRRLKAHKDLGYETIEAKIHFKVLNELEYRSLELEENIRRKELNFREEIRMKKDLHELQIKLHGKKNSTSSDAEGHSIRDTAKMLNVSPMTISNDLQLAEIMEAVPDIGWEKCRNKSEAMSIAKNLHKRVNQSVLAKEVNNLLLKEADGDHQKAEQIKIRRLAESYIVDDCFNGMKNLPSGFYNLIEVDPPYGIDFTSISRGYASQGYENYHEIGVKDYPEFLKKLAIECFRLAASESWTVLWISTTWVTQAIEAFTIAGFIGDFSTWGLWVKPSGQLTNPNHKLSSAAEMFIYFRKGVAQIRKTARLNTFVYSQVPHQLKMHAIERPTELMFDVLTTFGGPGDQVLVPFAGSGVTLIAAHLAGMSPVGFELEPSYKEIFTAKLMEVLK
jgi:ParB/RepB/Spo0J family partition protein